MDLISRYLDVNDPNINPTPMIAVMAAVVVALVLVGRLAARRNANAADRGSYTYASIIVALALAAIFAGGAFTGVYALPSLGNVIAVVGGAGLAVLLAMIALRLLRKTSSHFEAKRFFASRLPLTLTALLAAVLYVAVIGYSQTAVARASGSVAADIWWIIYRGALIAADLIATVLVPYLAVVFTIWLIMLPIRTHRARAARRAAAASTTP